MIMNAYIQRDKEHIEPSPDKLELRFYYSREERLKKLRGSTGPRRMSLFSKKRSRSLIIIFADIVLIAIVMYFISKPVNIFVKKQVEDRLYEVNVTGIRGSKVMVGFTVKNTGNQRMIISSAPEVIVKIYSGNKEPLVFRKAIDQEIILLPGESSAIIFILDEEKLPTSGRLELYFEDDSTPLFIKNVRF